MRADALWSKLMGFLNPPTPQTEPAPPTSKPFMEKDRLPCEYDKYGQVCGVPLYAHQSNQFDHAYYRADGT
jgi:hypothetical protein